MKIIYKIEEISQIIKDIKKLNKTIGFVPTMGALHNGHCSLFDKATEQSDITIASIFVNPTQFGPNEDYNKYPRNIEHDANLAKKHKINYIFAPDALEMYPIGSITKIEISKLTNVFEGKLRPGHFEGVAIVLIKLFNIIKPDYAVFGQKDYQQTLVVKQIVKDLNIDTKIIIAPTIRLDTGLAMSSRNAYLSEDEFANANIIYQAMESAKEIIVTGERNRKNINAIMHQILRTNKNIRIDYAAIANANDLSEPNMFCSGDKAVLLIAVYLGKTRLIDNSLINF